MNAIRSALIGCCLLALAPAPAPGQVAPDTTAPEVVITSPLADAMISGIVTVSVQATDASGVAGIALEVDGDLHGVEDTAAPWRFSWNAGASGPGSHVLTVVARDTAGNAIRSAVVPVVVGFVLDPPFPPIVSHALDATADKLTAPGGAALAFSGAALVANDGDPQGHAIYLSMLATSTSGGGTVTHHGGDSFTYTPAAGFTGEDAFIYSIADDFGGTATTTVTVTVTAPDPDTPVMTFPAGGAAGVLLTQDFTWTAVAGADAYVLHVGTAPGAFDVVRRGGLTQAAHRVREALPAGVPLFARARARVGGTWRNGPVVSFTAAPSTAALTYPGPGAAGVLLTQDFTWTAVPAVEAYVLQIGTTPGASDVYQRGNLTEPAHRVRAALPDGVPLYARVRSRVGGIWRNGPDVPFTAAPSIATITYPARDAAGVLLSQDFTWTAVPAVEAYVLQIGTAPGASDVYQRGNLTEPAHRVRAALPDGVPLYARVRSRVGGIWRDGPALPFTAAPSIATITAPADGAAGVLLPRDFTWSAVPAAELYILEIGTAPGAADAFRRGNLTQPVFRVPRVLPPGVPLYARVRSRVGGIWRDGPTVSFTVAPQ